MNIRQAQEGDLEKIFAIDHISRMEEERRQFISKSVHDGNTFIAVTDNQILGYSVLEHSFFNRGLITLIMVDPNQRRSGIGSALIHHVEGLCESNRIFTSTNESNQPMRALLKKLGYKQSGVVNDLDPGDPELFYSRKLKVEDNNVN